MNKFQKELLDKCMTTDDIPLLEDIYILPTTRKHDSGFKMMYVVGSAGEKYYLLDTFCDVLNIGDYCQIFDRINMDIPHNGIIHFWSNRQYFKSIYRVSSCTFEMVNK